MSSAKKAIHISIKEVLGYPPDISDKQFLKDWKHRSTQVCKPCWELKYCPYGPLVEQSPLLPSTRHEAVAHNEHLKKILNEGFIGIVEYYNISDKGKTALHFLIQDLRKNPKAVAKKVAQELWYTKLSKLAEEEGKDISEYFEKFPSSGLANYRVPYPLDGSEEEMPPIEGELKESIEKHLNRMEEIIRTGVDDRRTPLNAVLRKEYELEVSTFNENDYPEEIPQVVLDAECRNFGHICPVVFVGESITETAEKRRRGRYIPFPIKMRVVRRDNYTCQECGVHLKDDEVEFDHIIPHAKGGSAEEHNIRLTCFKCNRDKSDHANI